MFNPDFYFILPWSVIGAVFWWRRAASLELIEAGLLLAYLLVICTFSQSYSFAVLGTDPTFHFARYATEIAPLLALLGAGGIEPLLLNVFLPRLGTVTAALGGGGVLILSLLLGVSIRERFAAEEEAIRVVPTTWVCNAVRPDGIIISSRPILVALVCDPHRGVIDYSQIGYAIPQKSLKSLVTAGQVYLFWSSVESVADAQRYPYAARSLVEYRQSAVATDVLQLWRGWLVV